MTPVKLYQKRVRIYLTSGFNCASRVRLAASEAARLSHALCLTDT